MEQEVPILVQESVGVVGDVAGIMPQPTSVRDVVITQYSNVDMCTYVDASACVCVYVCVCVCVCVCV